MNWGQALAQKHSYDEAIGEFELAIALSGHSGAFDSNLAYVYALSGRKEEAVAIVRVLEARYEQNPSAGVHVALVYVGLGDLDKAMIWLNKAYEARSNPSILLRPAFRQPSARRPVSGACAPYWPPSSCRAGRRACIALERPTPRLSVRPTRL